MRGKGSAQKVVLPRRGYSDGSQQNPDEVARPNITKSGGEDPQVRYSGPRETQRSYPPWYNPHDRPGTEELDQVSRDQNEIDRTSEEAAANQEQWGRSEQLGSNGAAAHGFPVHTPLETPAPRYEALSQEREQTLLDIDYVALLPGALARSEADLTIRCLYAAARAGDVQFIQDITPDVFSEVLRVVEPANVVGHIAAAHFVMTPSMATSLSVPSMRQVAQEYAEVMMYIVSIVRFRPHASSLGDYAVLLRGARDIGSRGVTEAVWRLMHDQGVEPDTSCHNYYMSAALFGERHDVDEKDKLRIIPFHMRARSTARLGPGYESLRINTGGLKERVVFHFNKMLLSGALANEESFCIVIMAAACEGDISTVESLLRKVWHINVAAIRAGEDEAEILPKEMAKTSRFHPTSKLLFAIAHAFGINNDMPTALSLVDFVARHYAVQIELDDWNQLFDWTFVLATYRTGNKARAGGENKGLLPRKAVLNLWDTMINAPYFVPPSMRMYNHLMKNLLGRRFTWHIDDELALEAIIAKMQEGRDVARRSWDEADRLFRELQCELDRTDNSVPNKVSAEATGNARSLEKLRTEFEVARLVSRCNRLWLKRWVRLLLTSTRRQVQWDFSGAWSAREIPRFLWEWRAMAPAYVRYDTIGGIVEFKIRTEEQIQYQYEKSVGHRQRIFETLDRLPRYLGNAWLLGDRPVPATSMELEADGLGEEPPSHSRRVTPDALFTYARKPAERVAGS